MKTKLIVLSLIVLTVLAAVTAWPLLFRQDKAVAAPEVFASGISGGCYITAPNVCKIHVDPFIVNVNEAGGFKLVEFQLQANGSTIYSFKTASQSSYRPAGDYSPSLVMQDFAATCGETYHLNLLARDEGDSSLLNAAITEQFTCPASVP